ncbi:MAG: HPr(Ser) kinase/phosphatase [Clostridiales bacterium]|nr:HPr(Ser) kinase/phosphatase [Clostridiales bacterium]
MQNVLTLKELIDEQQLEIIHLPEKLLTTQITSPHANRCGMALMGFHKLHREDCVQIMGFREVEYLSTLPPPERELHVRDFLKMGMPALIITRNSNCDEIIVNLAREYNIPILRTKIRPSTFMSDFFFYVSTKLAPVASIYGVLAEVYGEGVLIMGEGGIGKSETAIDLVKRGHRLVSDDSVEVILLPDSQLIGKPPKLTQHFMEIRGIGIVNIRTLFGESAVLNEARITMVIQLVPWDNELSYERLGIDEQYTTILGVPLPVTVIPVRPGRNLAVIVEIEAINKRAKLGGNNSAHSLDTALKEHMLQKKT